MMSRLRTRAILLVAGGALVPLVVLGAISVQRARHAVLDEVVRHDHDLAKRAGAEIEAHVGKYAEILRRLADTLGPSLHLSPEQAERILKNYRMDVRDLRRVDFVGRDGREIATGRLDGKTRDRSAEEAVRQALAGRSFRSRVTIAQDDLVPEIVLAEPQRSAGEVVGAIVATIDLTEMWKVIDGIQIGEGGYARVVGEDETLLAVGTGRLKQRVFTREKDKSGPMVKTVLAGQPGTMVYHGTDGELLAVGEPLPHLGWGLILERPLRDAMAPYYRFTFIIVAISAVLLALAALVGWRGARSVVEPIERLRVRAGEIARGVLDARVEVRSPEELHALADAMNRMCEDLIRLQDDVRKKERIATLGRLAAGLAHDLKHPVRAIEAGARRMLERGDDPAAKAEFAQLAQREVQKMEGFLDDLRRVSRNEPLQVERTRLDLAALVEQFGRDQRDTAPACVELRVATDGPALIEANGELIGRMLSNLASNAYEAMEGDGTLTLRVYRREADVFLSVTDTGKGIAPEQLAGLFNDFATTKRHGLGLGLAVCRKIVADHGGGIEVHSEEGRGAEFLVRFPALAEIGAA